MAIDKAPGKAGRTEAEAEGQEGQVQSPGLRDTDSSELPGTPHQREASLVYVPSVQDTTAAESRSVLLDQDRSGDVDEWGRSEHIRAITRQLMDPFYNHWFRVEWEGLEKIPREGGALLVANHAGAIPPDAPIIMHGIEKELGRPVYGLADYWFRTIPFVNIMWSRMGGVTAHPDNALRIMRDNRQLALVFPEGTKATSKSFSDRYRLRRFGRGGFVEIAMRAGAPIIPLAVVGGEEAMPILFRLPGIASMLNLPYFPVTGNMLAFGPLLGPLGCFLYFPSKFKIKVLDPIYYDVEPGQERYSKSFVMEEAEQVRTLIQDTLYDMLRDRKSVFLG
ncbi:MAG: lysophospholipid acyltransferase family protein [Acidimicrobiales bacterium]